ncbi:MAG: response regulator [Parachlamydiales bacterium]|jgi:CheY-like chemotaxis protein
MGQPHVIEHKPVIINEIKCCEVESSFLQEIAQPQCLEHKPIIVNEIKEIDDRNSVQRGDPVLLIVEDDISFSMILKGICHKKGYKCLWASTGAEALDLSQKYLPKGITLDIELPDMSGRQILEKLKENPETSQIPVHVISFDADEALSLQKGAVGHLTKPVMSSDIEKALSNVCHTQKRSIKNVLVVEDTYSEQQAISNIIKNKNIFATIVDSGLKAIEKIQNEQFDCIILDLQLPDISGAELLRRINTLPTIKLPPVIVYTGRDLNKEEFDELNEYTSSFILKGINSKDRLLDELDLFLHKIKSKDNSQQNTQAPSNPNQSIENVKVLVVDDDMRNTFALSSALKKKGLVIILADNGKTALDKLQSEPGIELVIMDIMMPVMDGYEAISRIRMQKQYDNIPIIALTAKILPEDKNKAFEVGANDFLTKPVDVDKLLSLIKLWYAHAQNNLVRK